MNNKRYVIFLALFLAAGLLIAGKLFLWPASSSHDNNATGYPKLGGDFTLQSAEGPVSLSDYRGKVVILYFGYAFCPDVCPTSLGLLSLALRKLEPQELARVKSFFISVDPERDTVEKLKVYASAFHPNIMGITGSAPEIADVARRYGAVYMKVELPGSALGYAVDHSSRYYVLGPDGVVKKFIEHGTSPENIAAGIREVLYGK